MTLTRAHWWGGLLLAAILLGSVAVETAGAERYNYRTWYDPSQFYSYRSNYQAYCYPARPFYYVPVPSFYYSYPGPFYGTYVPGRYGYYTPFRSWGSGIYLGY